MRSTYSDLAAEYYDVQAHPTSANLRSASLSILSLLVKNRSYRRVCELGAGRSIFLDLQIENQIEELVLVDVSSRMLDHSASLPAARRIVADAATVALPDQYFDVIVASLGDPYNTSAVWNNASRMLRYGGRIIYTAPAVEWALSFRKASQRGRIHEADFMTKQGELSVPSFVLGRDEQVELWRSCSIVPTQWIEIFSSDLPLPHSSKMGELNVPFCIGISGLKGI